MCMWPDSWAWSGSDLSHQVEHSVEVNRNRTVSESTYKHGAGAHQRLYVARPLPDSKAWCLVAHLCPEFGTLALRSHSFSRLRELVVLLWVWQRQLSRHWAWLVGMPYDKHHFLALVALSHSLNVPDRVFSTSKQLLALAEMPRTRDLAITTTTTMTTQLITLSLCECARGNNIISECTSTVCIFRPSMGNVSLVPRL